MQYLSLVKRLKEVLRDVGGSTTSFPMILQETFNRLISEEIELRKQRGQYTAESSVNGIEPQLLVAQDIKGQDYVVYEKENWDYLLILEKDVEYFFDDDPMGSNRVIKGTETFLRKFEEVFNEMKNKQFDRFQARAAELFKAGKIDEYIEFQEKFLQSVKEVKDRTIEDYFNYMMDNFEQTMTKQDDEIHMQVDIAGQDVGKRGPRKDKDKIEPTGKSHEYNEAYDNRFSEIEEELKKHGTGRKIGGINEGEDNEYVIYSSPYIKDGKEDGQIIALEPAEINGTMTATHIIYISKSEFEKKKEELIERKNKPLKMQNGSMVGQKENNEITVTKNQVIQEIIEDFFQDKQRKSKMLYHVGDYEGFKKRLLYMITGRTEYLQGNDRSRMPQRRDKLIGR